MKAEKITVNELFSGIGAQVSALERLGIPCEIKHTSDIDHNAVLAYASIHCGLTEELINTYTEYPTREEMARQFTEINLGYDFQKNKSYNWYRFVNSKSKELEKYWLANKLSKNLGDISKLEHLDYADFWTYSFPCTDISVAGKQEGIKQGQTRSGLLYEVQRLLERANKMLVLYFSCFQLFHDPANAFTNAFDFSILFFISTDNLLLEHLNFKGCIPLYFARRSNVILCLFFNSAYVSCVHVTWSSLTSSSQQGQRVIRIDTP